MRGNRAALLAALALCASLLLAPAASEPTQASSSPPSSSHSHSRTGGGATSTATQARQSGASAAASLLGALGSLVPGLITNVAPLVLLLGIGALMVPSLGMSAMGLLRESRRSSNDQTLPTVAFPSAFAQYARPLQTSPQDIYYFTQRSLPSLMSKLNSAGIVNGLHDVLERVARAIDNADKRYN